MSGPADRPGSKRQPLNLSILNHVKEALKMKRIPWMAALASTAMVVALGCAASPPATSPVGGGSDDVAEATSPGDVAAVGAGETEDESTADLASHHRHHSHGGVSMFIAMSLDTIGATPDQEAKIKSIKHDLYTAMDPGHEAEKAALNALADGIAAGQIDQAKMDAAIAQVNTAAMGAHDAEADALNQLHATLDPAQRTALVDKVEAHLEVWHHANSAEEPASKDAHGGHLGKLSKELNLTPAQVEQIRGQFRQSIATAPKYDRAETEAHVKAFGEAFASDSFDAKTLTNAGTVNAHMATWGVTRTIHFYQAVLPVLTPEQRTKVAGTIRGHANVTHDET
jgi:Spy/CpxP family protein refolding chaperone